MFVCVREGGAGRVECAGLPPRSSLGTIKLFNFIRLKRIGGFGAFYLRCRGGKSASMSSWRRAWRGKGQGRGVRSLRTFAL